MFFIPSYSSLLPFGNISFQSENSVKVFFQCKSVDKNSLNLFLRTHLCCLHSCKIFLVSIAIPGWHCFLSVSSVGQCFHCVLSSGIYSACLELAFDFTIFPVERNAYFLSLRVCTCVYVWVCVCVLCLSFLEYIDSNQIWNILSHCSFHGGSCSIPTTLFLIVHLFSAFWIESRSGLLLRYASFSLLVFFLVYWYILGI